MTPWRRLHPASVWVNALPRTLKSIAAMWWLLIPLFAQENTARVGAIEVVLILVVFGTGLFSSFVHYSTLRYRIHENMLEIRYGLLHRRSRRLDPVRIQNLELIRNPLHKMSGLVELCVETAGEAREEGLLSALTESEALRLKSAIEVARGRSAPEAEEDSADNVVLTVSPMELAAFGISTSIRSYLVTVASMIALGFVFVFDAPETSAATELVRQVESELGGLFFPALILLGVSLTFVTSVIRAVIRHWGHRLVISPDGLRTEEGLFTRRNVEIPHKKVQVVRVSEPFLRRLMGYGTMSVETAGLGSVKEGVFSAETAVPMVARDEMLPAMKSALPKLGVDPWAVKLHPPAQMALRRLRVVGLLRALPAVVALSLLFFPWGLLSLLIGAWVWVISAWEWRCEGWRVGDDYVMVQRGILLRDTRVLDRRKVQALHLHQGPIMSLYGIARLHILAADASVSLPDLELHEAEAIMAALSPRSEALPTSA
ncbi:MAG: PH domain-containing protein [Myxococcota bacterium]|nr:PH domain-containing protein [Myxococcota bacterium]